MRLAQISDLHFTHVTFNPLRFCLKRLSGMANWLFFRRRGYVYEHLNALPSLFKTLNVDLILVGGDLTSTSLKSEFESARRYFKLFSQQKLFIPGNHDQYTNRSHSNHLFYDYFENKRPSINHPLDFFTLKEHGIEVHRIHPLIWCIALDTALPTSLVSSNGLFSLTIEKYLNEILLSIPQDGHIIVMNHFPIYENNQSLHRLIRAERLEAILEKHPNIHLYLHGHSHRHAIADLRPNNLPVIIDSGCPIQKDNSTWNLIDLNPDSCEVSGYRWDGKNWVVFKQAAFDWKKS